jgi:large subunit ribosomal protein L24e
MGSRPEARVAARQEAIKMGKEKRKLEDAKKKAEKAKVCFCYDDAYYKSAASTARGQAQKISKQQAKGARPTPAAKSR